MKQRVNNTNTLKLSDSEQGQSKYLRMMVPPRNKNNFFIDARKTNKRGNVTRVSERRPPGTDPCPGSLKGVTEAPGSG